MILTFNNKILTAGSKWLEPGSSPAPVDPYNPLGLPPNTVRVRTSDGKVPKRGNSTTYEAATLVPGTTDIYDVYKSGTDFSSMFKSSSNVVEVLGANATGITNMDLMFRNCSALTTVPLFDTSNVTTMQYMFFTCGSLTSVPLFNTSKVTNMYWMFNGCAKVQSGALALYQQASTQANPPTDHNLTFYNCGRDTVTGAAELAQIPSSWGGTAA